MTTVLRARNKENERLMLHFLNHHTRCVRVEIASLIVEDVGKSDSMQIRSCTIRSLMAHPIPRQIRTFPPEVLHFLAQLKDYLLA